MKGPMDMVILGFDKCFLVKIPTLLLIHSTKIGCLTLSLEEGMVVDHDCVFLLVLDVELTMRISS